MMEYKGYIGKAEFNDEAEIFYGEVSGLRKRTAKIIQGKYRGLPRFLHAHRQSAGIWDPYLE